MEATCFITGLLGLGLASTLASPFGKRFIVRKLKAGRSLRVAMTVVFASIGLICLVVPFIQVAWASHVALLLMIMALMASGYQLLTTRIAPEPSKNPKTVLAVGAHPDDLELACGGTLARLVDQGHEVHALIMSKGAVGGDASCRPDEAIEGASFFGLKSIEICDFPDTQLFLTENQIMDKIESVIGQIKPDIILTHSKNDQHQDHQCVHWAAMRASRNQHSILCFESPSVTADFQPDIFVDVEDYVDIKVEGVLIHKNQAGKPYMTPEVVKSITGFRGRQAKKRHAEAFEPVRLLLGESGVLS